MQSETLYLNCWTDPFSLDNPNVGSNITPKSGCRSEAAATSDEKLAGDYNQQQEKTWKEWPSWAVPVEIRAACLRPNNYRNSDDIK